MTLFGSAVKGAARDIDIAVFPKTGIRGDDINKLQLISELESLFNKQVDIIIVHSGTSTTLLYEICRNSLLLYEDERDSFQNERSLAFRKFADTFKFRRQRGKSIEKFIKGANVVS